jgi:hypothetical protein
LSDLISDEIVLGVLEKLDQKEMITLELPTQFGMPMMKQISVSDRIKAVTKDLEIHKKTLEVIEEKLKEEK